MLSLQIAIWLGVKRRSVLYRSRKNFIKLEADLIRNDIDHLHSMDPKTNFLAFGLANWIGKAMIRNQGHKARSETLRKLTNSQSYKRNLTLLSTKLL